jgi:hypothetical protein
MSRSILSAMAVVVASVGLAGKVQAGMISIFTGQIPAVQSGNTQDGGALELGTKFQSSKDGPIVGLRYYRSTTDSLQHTLKLWDTDNTSAAVATVSTSGDSGAGWFEYNLPTPYEIVANHIYVVSYDVPIHNDGSTHYVYTSFGLQTSVVNWPLSTLEGGNGVYSYSPGSNDAVGTYPTLSFHDSNYFADLVFAVPEPGALGLFGVGILTLARRRP